MKKITAFSLTLVLLCTLLCACLPKAPKITDRVWSLASVSTEDDRGISTLQYVSDAYVELTGEGEELPRVNYKLRAKRGNITLYDEDSDKKFQGIYENADEFSPDAMAYDIVMENKRGTALIMRGYDADENEFYTLSISVGNYALLFFK